jgi:methionyl-tRNA formyltransferase
MRVVFFGTSSGAFSNRHFASLLDAALLDAVLLEQGCSVVAVVDAPAGGPASTNKGSSTRPFTEEARRRGIPVFAPPKPAAPDFVQALAALEPDLFLAAGYTGIFRAPLLAVPRLLTANFHASLLPAYRGLHPLFWALHHGERQVGITVHVVDEGIDTGDILYQSPVPVREGDTVTTLYDRVMEESLPLVRRLVVEAAAGTLHRRPQPSEGASYYSHIPPDLSPRPT